MTDHDIAQLMNAHSLQGGNNDSPWWLTFARAVERKAADAENQVLRCQVGSLRDALVKVLETRDKEARETVSYRVARDNFSAGGRMEAADRLLVLQQLASSAEKEARLLLATLKPANARLSR